jgi:hypothetical protein
MNSHEHRNSQYVRPLDQGRERPDLRSVHVHEDVARSGRCGNVHMATGRTCILPERHHGSCEFVGPHEAEGIAGH